MGSMIISLAPWICAFCGILVLFFLLNNFLKSYFASRKQLLEIKLRHERDMKADEWEKKKEWETLLTISKIVSNSYDELVNKIKEQDRQIGDLKQEAEKATQLDQERAIQEKVMLIYQLISSKEQVTAEKMKIEKGQVRDIYDSIKNILK